MRFKVTKQYLRGGEIQAGQFNELPLAKKFIEEHSENDQLLKVKVIYRIFDFGDLIAEFESDKVQKVADDSGQAGSGSAGKGSSATFRPTPLNMAPRPPGTPQKWNKEEDDTDTKDKE